MTGPKEDLRLEKPYTKINTYRSIHGYWTVDILYLWPDHVEPWIQDLLNTIDSDGNRVHPNITFPKAGGGSTVWYVNPDANYWKDTDDL